MSHPGPLLSAYLDGELTRAERVDVNEHLDGCEECRAELGDLDAARSAVRSLPVLDPPFPGDVGDLIPARREQRRRFAPAWIAAAAAVMILVVLVVRDGSTEQPVDIASVMEQHTARVGVEPGVPAFRVVSVVEQP